MTDGRPPSLRTVAERAGVSVRTVSNVVNDYVHVAPATRAAVQQAIEAVGYRPNVAARQLRAGRTGLLGLVLPELASPYFAELAALITHAAGERGWTVLTDETRGDVARERDLVDRAGSGLVDGMIVSPWSLSPDGVVAAAGGLPLVVLGERTAASAARVAIDSVAAARAATEHLLTTGRRELAAIGLQPHLSNATATQRTRGFRAAMRAAGLPRRAEREMRTTTLHRADGAAAATTLVERDPQLDGLVCFTDELALGAIRALVDRGLRVPGDIAVVGIDDIEDGRYSVPRLSTVAPDKEAIARTAVRIVLDRIADPDAVEPGDVVVPHRLIVRESSG